MDEDVYDAATGVKKQIKEIVSQNIKTKGKKNKMKDVTNPIIGYLNKRTFIILNLRATNYLSDTICIDL